MAKKNYVIDTSVFLSDADCIFRFHNNDIFIPLKVLEEIDKHKKRQDSVGLQARRFIRHLDTFRTKGSLNGGIRIQKGKGIIKVCKGSDLLPESLDPAVPDHVILSSALLVQKEWDKRRTIMVSRDINMRVIADSIGLGAESYETEKVVADAHKLYSGFEQVVVDDQLIDQFYNDEEVILPLDLARQQKIRLYPNQFLMLVSSSNQKKTALCRFDSHTNPVKKVKDFNNDLQWGVYPRNKEQSFAFDLLFDDEIPLVSLIGKAGSGKTLIAIAAAMEQVLAFPSQNIDSARYKKIVVSRPVQPLGKDIGFLPGSMHEKMLPWLMPIQDNMQFILGNDRTMLKAYLETGEIEIEALTYIRGRSISNAFIIIDEAQNLTAHEVKTIITRVGENTKVVLTGDIEQIDNIYTNETSNGLAYAVEKFKSKKLSGHVTFQKGERSKIATLASKIL
ncbi:MAG: PhoH family protein [Pelagibacteraceae bacterium TMED247]|nr:MAG: PhoH family protein [Pelagibacteraceae bacterium TMED247]|tara:strand:+ start:7160 stop:8506 length:1347 start_codon:yes stop_codon:yes gene_type:complete